MNARERLREAQQDWHRHIGTDPEKRAGAMWEYEKSLDAAISDVLAERPVAPSGEALVSREAVLNALEKQAASIEADAGNPVGRSTASLLRGFAALVIAPLPSLDTRAALPTAPREGA